MALPLRDGVIKWKLTFRVTGPLCVDFNQWNQFIIISYIMIIHIQKNHDRVYAIYGCEVLTKVLIECNDRLKV